MAAGATVSVATKLPHGLVLRVFNMVERDMPVMGGGVKTERVAEPRAETAIVHGWSHAQNASPHCAIVAGYAITDNIDKGLWDLWLSQNKDSAMVKNGLIFANEKAESTTGKAKDGSKILSGLERLDPKKLPAKLEISDLMDKSIAGKL